LFPEPTARLGLLADLRALHGRRTERGSDQRYPPKVEFGEGVGHA